MSDPEADEERAARDFLQGIPPAPPLPSMTNIPPPPPPPLPPGLGTTKSSNSVMAAKFAAAAEAGAALTQPTFRPRHFFFYGSLMDPEVFQTITKSAEAPVMRKGSITGFKMKMWGIYPVLVPETEAGTDTKITGTWCMVDSHMRFLDLQEYETVKYTPLDCTIVTEDGTELKDSATFGWAGNPDNNELEDGVFNFERYQKYFKPSVVRENPSD